HESMRVGRLTGPLVGGMAPARMGIRASFVLGGLILLGCAAIVHWGVPRPPAPVTATATARPVRRREVAAVTLIVLGGSIQIFFFTSILPYVLTGFEVEASRHRCVRCTAP